MLCGLSFCYFYPIEYQFRVQNVSCNLQFISRNLQAVSRTLYKSVIFVIRNRD